MQNVYNSYTTVVSQTGTSVASISELSVADRAILDSIDYVDGTLIPKAEVFFKKVVTFANDVIFQSRVIFSDPDMAGQVYIQPGNTEVYVKFERAYPGVPVITLTPVGHFHMGVVSQSSKYGFTIEIENSASRPLLFNWVALMVNGGAGNYSAPVPTKTTPEPTKTTPVSQTVSGEVTAPAVQDIPVTPAPESTSSSSGTITESSVTPVSESTISSVTAGSGTISDVPVPESSTSTIQETVVIPVSESTSSTEAPIDASTASATVVQSVDLAPIAEIPSPAIPVSEVPIIETTVAT